jgi:acyl-CoA thioester hydrolase
MKDFIEKRIYYHDTDAGGVVYYASYLKYLEEGRTEYCRSKGIDVAEYAGKGIVFPVVRLEIDYKSPARYGDVIRVFTRPEKLGNASFCFSQEIRKGETVILQAKTVWACINRDFKPTRIPEEFRSRICTT